MEMTTLLERVRRFFADNEDADEYKDDITGMVFYQDNINGILIKSGNDYNDDDAYFMLYSDM